MHDIISGIKWLDLWKNTNDIQVLQKREILIVEKLLKFQSVLYAIKKLKMKQQI